MSLRIHRRRRKGCHSYILKYNPSLSLCLNTPLTYAKESSLENRHYSKCRQYAYQQMYYSVDPYLFIDMECKCIIKIFQKLL